MIYVRLIGGLGNQMFQYAAGRRLAIHHNTKLVLDRSWFGTKDPTGAAVRCYELDCFKIDATLTDKPAANYEGAGIVSKLGRKLGFKNSNLINEPSGGFHPKILFAPNGTILHGYWQNELYFRETSQIIRKDFTFLGDHTAANKEAAKKIASTEAISLHVRRGDYVASSSTNQFHGTSTLDYYAAAIAYVTKLVKNPHFYVFSDDSKWTKQNIVSKHPMTFVDNNPPEKGYMDMRLMSDCKHHIIANSSFSWWGAWLNSNPNKVVVAPKQWFNDPKVNAEHKLPPEWVRL
jgi:hypothetical protein